MADLNGEVYLLGLEVQLFKGTCRKVSRAKEHRLNGKGQTQLGEEG